MTMTQKILAAHSGRGNVRAGELIMAKLDLVLGNDITSPVAIREFPKFGRRHVFDCGKIALVPDHFTPNKDIKAAAQCAAMRSFAKEQGIANYFEVGHDCGIEHALLPEKGLVTAGDLVIGADSHTCTCGALGAFSTGVGSTDMAAGMAAGETWFRVPAAIKVVLKGRPRKWTCGKDESKCAVANGHGTFAVGSRRLCRLIKAAVPEAVVRLVRLAHQPVHFFFR